MTTSVESISTINSPISKTTKTTVKTPTSETTTTMKTSKTDWIFWILLIVAVIVLGLLFFLSLRLRFRPIPGQTFVPDLRRPRPPSGLQYILLAGNTQFGIAEANGLAILSSTPLPFRLVPTDVVNNFNIVTQDGRYFYEPPSTDRFSVGISAVPISQAEQYYISGQKIIISGSMTTGLGVTNISNNQPIIYVDTSVTSNTDWIFVPIESRSATLIS